MKQITQKEELQRDRFYYIKDSNHIYSYDTVKWFYDATFSKYSVYKIQSKEELEKLQLICKLGK